MSGGALATKIGKGCLFYITTQLVLVVHAVDLNSSYFTHDLFISSKHNLIVNNIRYA